MTTGFAMLFRLEHVPSLWYRIYDECVKRGISREYLRSGPTDEDLAVLTDEHDGPVTLGNGLGLVWVSDFEVTEPLIADVRTLADRLGMPIDATVSRIVVCAYERTKLSSPLHVPRVLDAIDRPEFQPNPDCSAPCGMTRPITGSLGVGLPEAVHGGCTLVPTR